LGARITKYIHVFTTRKVLEIVHRRNLAKCKSDVVEPGSPTSSILPIIQPVHSELLAQKVVLW